MKVRFELKWNDMWIGAYWTAQWSHEVEAHVWQAREETYPNMPDMSFHLVTPLRCPIRTYPHVIPFEFKSDFHDDFPSFWQSSRFTTPSTQTNATCSPLP